MHNSAIRTYVSNYIVSSFTNWGVQRGTSSEGLGGLGIPPSFKSPPILGDLGG